MEFSWININVKEPPKLASGIEYLVTVYSPYWNVEIQTKAAKYVKEMHGRKEIWVWYIDGIKVPGTWEVTHWGHMPKPAIEREDG
ncbi:hypothetical protein [Anaerocolumna xylanovorans]|uniref:DUF551 domain-containing protein n=1 Tax=Anaerocolumna xylanovorans DSM 12503 TaxID=1121345 RepID=A0A1M7YM60_9FIRM|nr:hypothetical protein [Anaerocolumna xylanovorans]SHO53680.1 hypothetical protein SAMN02745217_04231 [Anaerocolumna xylanovorans DSM 12503]